MAESQDEMMLNLAQMHDVTMPLLKAMFEEFKDLAKKRLNRPGFSRHLEASL